jgi:hypothetical protein
MTATNNHVKETIFEILKRNGFIHDQEGALDSFDYKVIRSKWTPHDVVLKFDSLVDVAGKPIETEEEDKAIVREYLMEKEHFHRSPDSVLIPRLVLVHYVEKEKEELGEIPYSARPPVGEFRQRGMVINLETSEILCVGSSWIETAHSLRDFNELIEMAETLGTPVVHHPIEGAAINMFYCPTNKEVFIGTNRRVLKLSKILSGGGSRWSFASPVEFNIHKKALEIFLEIGMEHMGISSADARGEEYVDFVNMIIRSTFFPAGDENVVYSGTLSGLPFANHSKIMKSWYYESTTFTLNGVSERTLTTDGKTTWKRSSSNGRRERLFIDCSLDTYAFSVDTPIDKLSFDDDVLLFWPMAENGTRQIHKYRSEEARFREQVIRGMHREEIEEIENFFPLHRNRKQGTAANIGERVRQVITLAIKGKNSYAFDLERMLGGSEATELNSLITSYIDEMFTQEFKAGVIHHWKDVAYPSEEFIVSDNEIKKLSPRTFHSAVNRRLCNALTVLYSSVAAPLKRIVVHEIIQFFVARAMIAATAFLPTKRFEELSNEYVKMNPQDLHPGHELPIGVYKLKRMISSIQETTMTNSKRKYRIADKVSNLSSLDVSFIMNFVGTLYRGCRACSHN